MKGLNLSEFNLPSRQIIVPDGLNPEEEESYITRSDAETYIYDGFSINGSSVLIAPPMKKTEIIQLYSDMFFGNMSKAESYINQNNNETYTTQAYTRVVSPLSFRKDWFQNTESLNLFNAIANKSCKNISYTLQKNNPIEWIVDWAKWQVDECGSDLVVIYDNNSDYKTNVIEEALNSVNINNFVLSVPFKYGPAWVPSNPWGAQHLWLQRACLEHIRMISKFAGELNNTDVLVLNTDIDELLHTPVAGEDIYETMRLTQAEVGHFVRLPVYPEKEMLKGSKITHTIHNLVKKDLKCQSPKNIFNASKLALNVPMHQHVIGNDKVKAVLFKNVFASHCIAINTGWKYQLNGMTGGWVEGKHFTSFDLKLGYESISEQIVKESKIIDWSLNNKWILEIDYPFDNN